MADELEHNISREGGEGAGRSSTGAGIEEKLSNFNLCFPLEVWRITKTNCC